MVYHVAPREGRERLFHGWLRKNRQTAQVVGIDLEQKLRSRNRRWIPQRVRQSIWLDALMRRGTLYVRRMELTLW